MPLTDGGTLISSQSGLLKDTFARATPGIDSPNVAGLFMLDSPASGTPQSVRDSRKDTETPRRSARRGK